MSPPAGTLIKVGGSLFDLPDLGARLRNLLTGMASERLFLFPGGGPTADVVRDLDRVHGLGEEFAHWMALRTLTVNAYFLQALLPELPVALGLDVPAPAILEPCSLALSDEKNSGRLPHTWNVTSDSLAARAAHLLGARELLLLKSIGLADGMTWQRAAQVGFVDEYFPRALALAPGLQVRVVNFRS